MCGRSLQTKPSSRKAAPALPPPIPAAQALHQPWSRPAADRQPEAQLPRQGVHAQMHDAAGNRMTVGGTVSQSAISTPTPTLLSTAPRCRQANDKKMGLSTSLLAKLLAPSLLTRALLLTWPYSTGTGLTWGLVRQEPDFPLALTPPGLKPPPAGM